MNQGQPYSKYILSKLLDLLVFSHKIFDEAVAETLEEFAAKKEEIDPSHYSNSVRYNAKRRFAKLKPPDIAYELKSLANNGIEVAYKGHTIKYYKGVDGLPPAAGQSKTRKAFYTKSLFGDDHEADIARELVVIWNVTQKERYFLGLDLTCPIGVVDEYEPPQLHWSEPVPHPATVQEVSIKYDPKPDELDDIKRNEDEDDLGISKDGTEDE